MPKKRMPISSDVLAWAIAESGTTVEQLAEQADLNVSDLAHWLDQSDQPGIGELRRVGKVLNRTPSFFLRSRPPQQSSSAVTLRIPYGERAAPEVSPEERTYIRRALRQQKIAKWASSTNSDFSPPRLPNALPSAEETADAARVWLKWSLRDQTTAASKSAVTRQLRLRFESENILVLQFSMGDDSCRGFSAYDPQIPLIVYNSSGQTTAARSFTLLHELAHLIHREDAVCGSGDSEHERWCDSFATAFLMPRDVFVREVVARTGLNYIGPTDVASVRKISNHFKASYQSVALRLWETSLADFALFEHIRDGKHEDGPGFARGGSETPEVRLREYGIGFARIILDAYDSNNLTEADVRKYLNVNGAQLSDLERLVSGTR